MTRGERILPLLCLGVAALQLALTTGAIGVVVLAFSPALVSLWPRKQLPGSVPVEMLALIGCGLVGLC